MRRTVCWLTAILVAMACSGLTSQAVSQPYIEAPSERNETYLRYCEHIPRPSWCNLDVPNKRVVVGPPSLLKPHSRSCNQDRRPSWCDTNPSKTNSK
jgi:hypothetical protein